MADTYWEVPTMAEYSAGSCEVETSTGPCGSTTSSRNNRKSGMVLCGTHRSQLAKRGRFRLCLGCNTPISSGKHRSKICEPCFERGCRALTTEGECGGSLEGGRGGVLNGTVLCRRHREHPISCDGCGGLLPLGSGAGSFSDLGRWCSDECQLTVKYRHMEIHSFYQENESFTKPCRIYTAGQNEKGYPRIYGRFGDVQVWLGHRLAWFYANGVSASEMLDEYSGLHLDHMCQNKGCFEPTHMQWLDHDSHMRVTWDRHTPKERAQRAMRIALGHISDPLSASFEWNGHRVTIEPV